ncbi:patatin family protein, partial [Cystoisospora suis]
FSRSYIGTKYQVEEFLNEVYLCLKELKKHIPHHREDVRRTSHHLQKSWGTTALVFSG